MAKVPNGRGGYRNVYQGRYRPKNRSKYRGNVSEIFYRSGWELAFMKYMDNNKAVTWWQSECVAIPYISPVDGRPHQYFPDFIFEIVDRDGVAHRVVAEVKPYSQTIAPEQRKRVSKRYLTEAATYAVNNAKKLAAQKYCKQRGMVFRWITESDLKRLKLIDG